ncbi:MAG TPA: aminotransferase class I/II-fold pyridoxal phosphate-dependent enzyme [Saprospiraceae bacterium]|nr:aminotransferase class I/II-fold pyridoxal phosphate-dependent enzyme [Saprospiraceae bacterium]
MLQHFFSDNLLTASSRIAPSSTSHTGGCRLDKNEQSEDVEAAFKRRVIEKLVAADWNRYPAADHRDIEERVAQYCGLSPENIVLSAGSASLITTLLDYFALQGKHIVITQPSYSLFDYHCKTYNIPYEPWLLSPELEYDTRLLPELRPGSVLIVTSPNNPVGNTLPLSQLEHLLRTHPDSYVVLDGVYTEFCDADATPLLKEYPNLIILRSFSKAFPVAGLRLGYLCASPQTAAIVRKLVLQFSINHFSLLFAREMLADAAFMAAARKKVLDIIAERERLYQVLTDRFSPRALQVFPSAGNFLLMRIHDPAAFEKLMADLAQAGIKVLNTSGFSLLHGTFRVSVGTPQENEAFLHCLSKSLPNSSQPAVSGSVLRIKLLALRRSLQELRA